MRVQLEGAVGGSLAVPAALAAAAQPPAAPANVSATFKGRWAKELWPAGLPTGMLRREQGVAVLRLRSWESPQPGLHRVQGEVVMRDGAFVSDGDALFRVQVGGWVWVHARRTLGARGAGSASPHTAPSCRP